MNLILWRHAQAEDGLADMSRELTEKGQKQAGIMAAFLRRHLPVDTRILVSPATRTQQTASALTSDFTTLQTIAPGADAHALLQAAQWPDAGGTVLLVGHQPALGEVAAQLLGSEQDSLRIKKGGLWWFVRRENPVETTLRLAITPDYL
jgi:phosphohistidine phosphatase